MALSEILHLILRWVHIIPAFVGLALFWVPVFAKKGGRLHVLAGWGFVWCAAFVGITGLIASLWAILDVESFAGPTLARIPAEELPRALELGRFVFSGLAYLSLWLLGQLWFGVRVARTRDRHTALRTPLLFGLQGGIGLAALGLAGFGAWNLLSRSPAELLPPSESSIYWIPLAIGLHGLKESKDRIAYVVRARSSPLAWWYEHMQRMLTVGVAFHTAFAVFGVHRLFGLQLPGAWQFVPWVIPSVIGVPAIRLWVRVYRQRFGEESKTRVSRQRDREAIETGGVAQESATGRR